MQEVSSNHADHLGIGYHQMVTSNMVWVLSRMKIYFCEFPTLDEPVFIETWPRGVQQKIFCTRDYKLFSPLGKPYAAATSAYLIIDPVKRRMLLPNSLVQTIPANEGIYAVDELLERIATPDEFQQETLVTAEYSDVDLLGHVNNARYIEWICDSFPQAQYQKARLDWLQINYNNEVKPGEQIALRISSNHAANTWTVSGHNLTSGVVAFDAAVAWKPLPPQ